MKSVTRKLVFALVLIFALSIVMQSVAFAGEAEGDVLDVVDTPLEELPPMEMDVVEDELIADEQAQLPAESLMDKEPAPDARPAADSDFEINSYGVITKYTGSGGAVTIPETINGIKVTEIGDRAFISCEDLTSITLPHGVTSIGKSAFEYCISLTSISIPDGVTSIGSYAFSLCSLTNITLPNSLTSIGDFVFELCGSLKSIIIPDSVTSIGSYAFQACTGLTEIIIPNSVRSIEMGAFIDCKNLASITIPSSVTNIGQYAFVDCAKSFTIYGTPGSYAQTYANTSRINFKETGDPAPVFSVNSNGVMFWYNGSGGAVTIPETINGIKVTTIGDYAFQHCETLTGISIPRGVTSIGNYAFYYCTGLTSITIPDGVTSIGRSAFYYCKSLVGIAIPDGVTSIGDYAFEDCYNLKVVAIPSSVTSIGDYAFRSGASDFVIKGVSGSYAQTYADKNRISFVAAPAIGGDTPVGDGDAPADDFEFVVNKGTASLTIIKYVGDGGNVKIPEAINGINITAIDDYAFQSRTSITSLIIPNSVTSIGVWAFNGCRGLTSVTLSNSVTSIRDFAFDSCESLTSISIPDNVTSIGEYVFSGCTSLKSISISNSVTSIGAGAFSGCSSLTSVNIPNGLSSIEWGVFSGCSSLKSISIPDSVTSIGNSAFAGCASLTSVTIPSSVRGIGTYAFSGCANGLTIYGSSGSYAQTYANNSGIPFISTDANGKPAIPKSVKASSKGYNSVAISWAKASNATGYQIYRSTSKNGTYKNIKTINSGSTIYCTDSGLTTGKTYYYKVVAFSKASGSTVKSAASAIVSAKPVVSRITTLETQGYPGGKVKLTWTKPAGATGYYVYRATIKVETYTKIKTITNGSTQSFTNTGLTTGKTYYYKIVPYRTVSGKKVKGTTSVAAPGKAG